MNKVVVLKKGKEESLRRFHPWVFSGAIHHIEGQPDEGDVVRVVSAGGDFLGWGHVQIGSIAVRILTFHEADPIDATFWRHRLRVAYDVRRTLGLTDSYRLVHGEGDDLPGLVIDIYGSTAVMQAHSVGMHVSRHAIAEALAEVMNG